MTMLAVSWSSKRRTTRRVGRVRTSSQPSPASSDTGASSKTGCGPVSLTRAKNAARVSASFHLTSTRRGTRPRALLVGGKTQIDFRLRADRCSPVVCGRSFVRRPTDKESGSRGRDGRRNGSRRWAGCRRGAAEPAAEPGPGDGGRSPRV